MIATALLLIDPTLGVIVLVGVPVLVVALGPLLCRIDAAASAQRGTQAVLTGRLVDVLAGLRVLGGLGGGAQRLHRYRADSTRLRGLGDAVARPTSWVLALAAGLPALFVAAVVWPAARLAATGAITLGELIAVYGYAAVLVGPVAFLVESAANLTAAATVGRRVAALLALIPQDRGGDRPVPAAGGPLHDPATGFTAAAGRFTALVTDRPAEAAAVLERLARFAPTDATWAGQRVDELCVTELRTRLLIADPDAELFAGALREVLVGRASTGLTTSGTATSGAATSDAAVRAAVHVACADDVVDALPDGLDSDLGPGAGSVSGGQRQRLRLARAVHAAPDVLLALDPTSAVDAHTEAVIADRLHTARRGTTTVVATGSPLVLAVADEVVVLVGGQVIARGRHTRLWAERADYRALVGPEPEDR